MTLRAVASYKTHRGYRSFVCKALEPNIHMGCRFKQNEARMRSSVVSANTLGALDPRLVRPTGGSLRPADAELPTRVTSLAYDFRAYGRNESG